MRTKHVQTAKNADPTPTLSPTPAPSLCPTESLTAYGSYSYSYDLTCSPNLTQDDCTYDNCAWSDGACIVDDCASILSQAACDGDPAKPTGDACEWESGNSCVFKPKPLCSSYTERAECASACYSSCAWRQDTLEENDSSGNCFLLFFPEPRPACNTHVAAADCTSARGFCDWDGSTCSDNSCLQYSSTTCPETCDTSEAGCIPKCDLITESEDCELTRTYEQCEWKDDACTTTASDDDERTRPAIAVSGGFTAKAGSISFAAATVAAMLT